MLAINPTGYDRTLRLPRSRTRRHSRTTQSTSQQDNPVNIAAGQPSQHRSPSRTHAPACLTRYQYVATQRRSLSTKSEIIALASARAMIV